MTITSAGYIVTDNELVHGIGATADAAWADAMQTLESGGITVISEDDDSSEQQGAWMRGSDLKIRSASAALIRDVIATGGNISWWPVRGVCCTREEEEG